LFRWKNGILWSTTLDFSTPRGNRPTFSQIPTIFLWSTTLKLSLCSIVAVQVISVIKRTHEPTDRNDRAQKSPPPPNLPLYSPSSFSDRTLNPFSWQKPRSTILRTWRDKLARSGRILLFAKSDCSGVVINPTHLLLEMWNSLTSLDHPIKSDITGRREKTIQR
jgi:hypothetical protein